MQPLEGGRILVVDDEEPIRTLLSAYLRNQGFQTATAANGHEALAALAKQPADLVLSDVRMPGMDGITLLGEVMRRYPESGVLMLTGCEDVSMAVGAMKAGALDYLLKPFELAKVRDMVRGALERWQHQRAEACRVRDLEAAVKRQTVEVRRLLANLDQASESTLEALVTALDAREHETKAHSRRVGEYAVYLAREMGLDGPALEVIRRGAMLHDIGKIGIPDHILLKPSHLTEAEWCEMRKHPQIGYWILSGIEPLRSAAEMVLCHHERFDGRGYPRGLRGEEIVLGARIFSVVDSLDAITSDRPYHRGAPYEVAREEIAAHAGSQFDPLVVEEFLEVPLEVWDGIRARTLAEKPRTTPEVDAVVLK